MFSCDPKSQYLAPYFSIKRRKAATEGPDTFYVGLGNKAVFYSTTKEIRSFYPCNIINSANFLFPSFISVLSCFCFVFMVLISF